MEEELIRMDAVQDKSDRHKVTGYKPPDQKQIAITPERREQIEKLYSSVVVHNFGDDYHLSEEERIERNALYAAFRQIRSAKRKYNRLSEYVIQFRNCLDCLEKVADVNKTIYPKEEFIKDVLKGKIDVYGLKFPMYKGRDRKQINWDYISAFILDRSRDPIDLEPKEYDEQITHTEKEADDKLRELFTDNQLEEIFGASDYPEEIRKVMDVPFDQDEDSVYEGLVIESDYKETKRLIKKAPIIVHALRDMRRKRSDRDNLQSFVYQMNCDDFEKLERLDQERGLSYDNEPPKFKGDITNPDDYNRYLYKLSVWEEEHTKVEYDGKLRTLEEVEMAKIRSGLESCGWNVRNIYGNKEQEKRLKAARRKDKKKAERLKKRLVELEKRNKAREDGDFKVNSKEKKKKKNKVKGKHKKAAKKVMGSIIMNASEEGRKHKSFKEYKNKMEDFTWNS